MTGEKIIVMVSDRGDGKHGEISVLDDAGKAERLVETLLEAGFEPDRIRVYTGRASEFQVSHRPVVSLADEGVEPQRRPGPVISSGEPSPQETAREPQPADEPHPEPEASAPEPEPRVESPVESPVEPAQAPAETPEPPQEEAEVTAGAQPAAPVRFSSLFRSA